MLERERRDKEGRTPAAPAASEAMDSAAARLGEWGSVNGYYLQRTYRHESATAARCALWGSARPYALYAGGSRQSCVLWQANGLSSARGRESCS